MARYLLVNSSAEIDSFSKLIRGHWPEDLVLVASSSAGMVACERARKSYTTLDSYSSRNKIIDLGWKNYSSLAAFCEGWDAYAQRNTPTLKERCIKPFRFGYYDLKILIDSISTKLLMLGNFLHHANGQEIFYLPDTNNCVASGEFMLPRHDANIVAILLETFFYEQAKLSPLGKRGHAFPARLKELGRECYVLARAQLAIIRNAFQRLRPKHRDKTLSRFLCFNPGHDIRYVMPQLERRQIHSLPLPALTGHANISVVKECSLLWKMLSTDKEFRGFFSQGGRNYFALIERPLKEYVQIVLPRAVANYDHLRAQLSRFKVAFSITSTINLGLVTRCRMLAAQACGAPLITYHEGAGYGSIVSPIYDFTEILDGDAMLCYGAGNREYYLDLGTARKPIIPVGSAHQDAIRKGLPEPCPLNRIRSIMYVSTAVDDNVMHCPNNGLVSTFYRATQFRIFRLLASLPVETKVIAKPHSADIASRQFLQLTEFRRISLENRQFETVLNGIDLFIIDFPSTVLLSSIATAAYVFVLVEEGVTGLTPKQRERLEKRAYLFADIDSLASAVREIVTNIHKYPPRLDQSYLLAYGVHLPDGQSAKRATKTLANFNQAL